MKRIAYLCDRCKGYCDRRHVSVRLQSIIKKEAYGALHETRGPITEIELCPGCEVALEAFIQGARVQGKESGG